MKIINSENGYSLTERESFIPVIHRNIFSIFDAILLFAEVNQIDLKHELNRMQGYTEEEIDFFIEFIQMIQTVSPLKFMCRLDMVSKVQALYASPPLQSLIKRRNEFDLADHADYFINELPRICKDGFLPEIEDILRVRVKTVGIVEKDFQMGSNFQFKMVDVGGQRNERRKWIHAFSNVTIVLFIMALSEYDQMLAESDHENRMKESIDLFRDICENKHFRNKSIVLFLNKKDLFEQKLKETPLSSFFKDYNGDNSFNDATKYVTKYFESLNKNSKRKIYSHVTCATDTSAMKLIFDTVRGTILQELLHSDGQM